MAIATAMKLATSLKRWVGFALALFGFYYRYVFWALLGRTQLSATQIYEVARQRLLAWYGDWVPRLVAVCVAVAGVSLAFAFALLAYGGDAGWPALTSGLLATTGGVFLALFLERSLEVTLERRNRRSAVRRVLPLVRDEVFELQLSLETIAKRRKELAYQVFDLRVGAWETARRTLSDVLEDLTLVGDLSRFYGRIGEIEYWLRIRGEVAAGGRTAELNALDAAMDEAVAAALKNVPLLEARFREEVRLSSI